eukprot:3313545-Prorocentrum_lima.AAC.1
MICGDLQLSEEKQNREEKVYDDADVTGDAGQTGEYEFTGMTDATMLGECEDPEMVENMYDPCDVELAGE